MSKERQANWQNPILSGLLMSDLRKKEWIKSRSNFEYRTVKILQNMTEVTFFLNFNKK